MNTLDSHRLSTVYLLDFEEAALRELRAGWQAEVELVSTSLEGLPERADERALYVLPLSPFEERAGAALCGMDALWSLRASHPGVPWVGVTRVRSTMAQFLCHHAGAMGLFEWDSFADALERWLSDYRPHAPSREDYSLVCSIHMAHLLELSAQIQVACPSRQAMGWIFLEDGELIYAQSSEGLEGIEALEDIVCWEPKQRQIFAAPFSMQKNIDATFFQTYQRLSEAWARGQLGEPKSRAKERGHMADLSVLCQEVVAETQDALACAVIDLDSGMLMGLHHALPELPEAQADSMAAAAAELLRGREVRRIERLLSTTQDAMIRDSIEEAFVRTQDTFNFLKVLPKRDAMVLLVLRSTANQGLGWIELEAACQRIEGVL